MNADLLEAALAELGAQLDLPTGDDDFADEVLERIAATEPTIGWPRRVVAVAAAVVLVLAATAVLSVGSMREAVADWLGLGVVPVRLVEELPADAAGTSDVGQPMALEDAEQSVDLPLLLPAGQGAADAVYLDATADRVTMRWDGLTITQQPVELAGSKLITDETDVDAVTVRGRLGLWLSGAPHVVGAEDATGSPAPSSYRLVPNVLTWDEGGVLVRIEIKGSLEDALAVAERLS
jgi:hypothetical protein